MDEKRDTGRVCLEGRVALVTGSAMGIGRAVCQALLDKKVKVCMTDVNADEGAKTLKELMLMYGEDNIMFAKCDVVSEEKLETAIQATKSKFGHLDILINNAGVGGESDWERIIDINLKAVIRGTLLAQKHLADKDGIKGGTVINTASILGLKCDPFMPAYCASKHAVVGWSKCWGMKCNVDETKVKVNVVCPNAVDTVLLSKYCTMVSNAAKLSTNEKKIKETMQLMHQTIISPSDAAAAYIKILEDDVTGAVLIVGDKGIEYHKDNVNVE